MHALLLEMAVAGIFPRVQDPWPHSIGLGFPFATAGAGGVVADLFMTDAEGALRDRAVRLSSLWAFKGGAFFYLVSFLAQVVFGL